MDKWDACAFVINEAVLEGRICYSELELSSTTDITTFVIVFLLLDENDKYTVLPYFWVPENTLELRVERDQVIYDLRANETLYKQRKEMSSIMGTLKNSSRSSGIALTSGRLLLTDGDLCRW